MMQWNAMEWNGMERNVAYGMRVCIAILHACMHSCMGTLTRICLYHYVRMQV